MNLRAVTALSTATALLLWVPAVAAAPRQSNFVRSLDEMMVALAPESAHASATVRRIYKEHLDFLMLNGYSELEGALDNGGLVPLPANPRAFNLAPRLEGPHPIGEKDLDNQSSYVAARAATLGMLIEIASQVKSGPVELTSLVRHSHYQDALKTTNSNANTSVPMHTMGLAADIGLVNSKLRTVYEIRDVLRKMQRRGEILVIGERRQLVFHVVPNPSKIGHFTDVYIRKVGLPPTSRSAHVVAAGPVRIKRAAANQRVEPRVTAEVLAFLPATYQAPAAPASVVSSTVSNAGIAGVAAATVGKAAGAMLQRWLVLLAGLLGIAWRITARPPIRAGLFERSF